MRKAYQRILNIKVSWLIIALVAVAASIFLLGGGVYDIIVKPPLVSKWKLKPFVDYRLNEQVLSESIIVMLLYTIGFVGLVTMYLSTKYVYNPRQAIVLLLVGAVLVILAYFFCENIISGKLWVPL